jgi:F0F1-type ATP synthase assembly protein I
MRPESDRGDQQRQQSLALNWVSRVLAICVVMVLPGIGGGWLDRRFGTGYWTVIGFVFGFASGFTALILLVKRDGGGSEQTRSERPKQ